MRSYLIIFAFVVGGTNAHSWLVCTDYLEKNARDYSSHKCRGYPRAANKFLHTDVVFGEESGYDHEPAEDVPCRVRRNDRVHYDSEYPMAVYYPGQQVVLAHPMKGHGGDADCTNAYIPDTGNWIYRSVVNVNREIPLSEYRKNLVFDLGVSPVGNDQLSRTYPKPGFQNGPDFCLNQDQSLATYSFNVPLDLDPGRYSFMWLWAFNYPTELFSTCFEVEIARNQLHRNRILRDRGYRNLSVPCGGITSNPAIRGTCDAQSTVRYSRYPGGSSKRTSSNIQLAITNLIVIFMLAYPS